VAGRIASHGEVCRIVFGPVRRSFRSVMEARWFLQLGIPNSGIWGAVMVVAAEWQYAGDGRPNVSQRSVADRLEGVLRSSS